jgi:SAM-dependent methyltransferase
MSASPADVRQEVRRFYETYSFPGYEEFETPFDLLEKAQRGVYAKLLDEQLPLSCQILDAGCGTGQLAIFLSLAGRAVLGIDLSQNSLSKANAFKEKFHLQSVSFARMNLFSPTLNDESFDYVFSNGVLHHTANAYGAFQNLCRTLKPGGFFVLGLYNTYGRLFLKLRQRIFQVTNDRLTWLDYFMRRKALGGLKKQIWFMDQYRNPHEDTFTVQDVLRWFRENGLRYINSVPKIRIGDQFTSQDHLFEPHDPGGRLDHFFPSLSGCSHKERKAAFS